MAYAGERGRRELGRRLAVVLRLDADDFLIDAVGEPDGVPGAPERGQAVAQGRSGQFGEGRRKGADVLLGSRRLHFRLLAGSGKQEGRPEDVVLSHGLPVIIEPTSIKAEFFRIILIALVRFRIVDERLQHDLQDFGGRHFVGLLFCHRRK